MTRTRWVTYIFYAFALQYVLFTIKSSDSLLDTTIPLNDRSCFLIAPYCTVMLSRMPRTCYNADILLAYTSPILSMYMYVIRAQAHLEQHNDNG